MKTYAIIAVLLLSADANGGELRACEVKTHAAYPAYEQTPGTDPRPGPDFHQSKTNSIARGDYDGDGRKDSALLLRPRSGSANYAISVCLSSKPTALPELIREAYTTGELTTIPRGQKYYDFDDGSEGKYELDGVGTSCCECCGATYIFRAGRFVEIVDSD